MRAFVIHAACQQIHRRTADKTRYKQAGGLFVDFNWCANLFGNAKNAGIILGAKVPIVLVSRADSAYSKLASIALGSVLSSRMKLA